MFLTCLIGNMEFLCMHHTGIGHNLAARGKSHEFFRVAAGTWGIFSSCGGDGHLKLGFVHRRQDSCLVTMETSRIETMLVKTMWMLLEVRQVANCPLLVGKVILGFLSIFTKTQTSSPFEALNSVHLSRCQRDVSAPVQKRWRFRAFSRVSTGDSDIPSSYEMKDEPAFKTLQGNPDFY